MSDKSDLQLVSEFQNGNIESFNELVRRYQQKVYWIARRMIGNHDDADDIVQEVFVKVHKYLNNFRSESSFYTWLYRIATNMSINAIRKKKLVEWLRFDEVLPAMNLATDESQDPSNNIVLQENRAMLSKAIAGLPAKQKQVFIFRYYDELPYEEISKIMKTSVGGLKANYFHAVKNIKKYFKDNGDDL